MNTIVLGQWRNGIRISQVAHLRTAAHYRRLHRMLGIPVTALTTVVGTSIFSTLGSSHRTAILIVVGAVSMLAAVMAGLQTFLNSADLAGQHQTTGAKYGRLRRRIEWFQTSARSDKENDEFMKELREEWDALDADAPVCPQRFFDLAMKKAAPVPSLTNLGIGSTDTAVVSVADGVETQD